ncbi:MAG TPA: TRAP transporter large permease [Syntrophorhabdaceae bacterium]|mgnify:CR=1 FL=1|nr:TRAP transporter large permease [Syntrophorhabdaceae bacterium]HQM82056.1 TRAP transporter large permease [Syntrophorhabdaceae bacterium]
MNEVTIGIVGLFLLLALFMTGIELGFAMAIAGFIGFSIIVSFESALNLLATDIFETFSSYGLTVIPLFVLMGQVAFNAGIAKRLYGMAYKFIGGVPGGLAIATVMGATAFKAICGSSPATAATFASVAVPEMDQYSYSRKLSTGVVAIVGTLGILLPPSVTLIILGLVTEQSIGTLFLAGLVPGLIIALSYIVIIIVWCKINPSLGPKGSPFEWKEKVASLPEGVWPIIIFLIIISGLLKGIFTPTEAGSIGTFAVLILCFLKRDLDLKGYWKSVQESLRTASMIFVILAGSTIMGHFIAVTKIPLLAADWISGLPINRYIIMAMIIIIYEIGGSFIDDLAFMILATPVFFPTIKKLGFDPIWFCILIGVTVMIGVVIPPVASNVFVVKNITKESISVIYKGALPFMISLIACTILLFLFPQITLFLPSLFMK